MLNHIVNSIEEGKSTLALEAVTAVRPVKTLWTVKVRGLSADVIQKLNGEVPTLLNIAIVTGQVRLVEHILAKIKDQSLPDNAIDLLAMQLCQPTLIAEKIEVLRVVLSHPLFYGCSLSIDRDLKEGVVLHDLWCNLCDLYGMVEPTSDDGAFLLGDAADCFLLVCEAHFVDYNQKVHLLQKIIEHANRAEGEGAYGFVSELLIDVAENHSEHLSSALDVFFQDDFTFEEVAEEGDAAAEGGDEDEFEVLNPECGMELTAEFSTLVNAFVDVEQQKLRAPFKRFHAALDEKWRHKIAQFLGKALQHYRGVDVSAILTQVDAIDKGLKGKPSSSKGLFGKTASLVHWQAGGSGRKPTSHT